MNVYFDESIFESGFTLKNYTTVRVYNEADRFLANRLNKEIVSYDCDGGGEGDDFSITSSILSTSASSSDGSTICDRINNAIDRELTIGELDNDLDNYSDDRVVNLNPNFPCRGINIYTLNILNKDVISTLPFNRIKVDDNGNFYPIYIGDITQIGSGRLTVGPLSPIESALMLKYFAIHEQITISVELYLLVSRLFVDYRSWFQFSADLGVLETPNHTLLLEGKPIETYDALTFSGKPVDLL